MKKVIWKYELGVDDSQIINIPTDGEMLTAQMQKDNLCLWVLVDPTNKPSPRVIEIHGTGNPIDYGDGLVYISTFQVMGGELIFHVFERV